MTAQLKRASDGVPVRLCLSRANDAVNTLAAGIPAIRLGPDAREEFTLELAALMGRLKSLLSLLWQGRNQPSGDQGREAADPRLPPPPAASRPRRPGVPADSLAALSIP
jgi:hypothetical protein